MRIKSRLLKGLLIALAVVLIPVTAVSAQKLTPGSTCKVLNQKVVYKSKTYTCTNSGKKLIWSKGVAVKKSTPTPEVPYPGVSEIERNLYLKMDAIIKEWAPYLSALENNKVKVVSEVPSHPRNEENRLSAEVSFEIIGKMLSRMVSPMYYMYETAEWADKQMASTCPRLVGQNPTGTSSGANAGCGKVVISNLNGWMNNIAGIDGSWFESAHETFHNAQFAAAIVGNDPNNSLSLPSFLVSRRKCLNFWWLSEIANEQRQI